LKLLLHSLSLVTMIALRGIVRQNEEKKWIWRGIWTFGSLPEDEEAALQEKNPSVRPFVYSWEEARNAADVLVPSANVGKKEVKSEVKNEAVDSSKVAAAANTTNTMGASKDVEMTDSSEKKPAAGEEKPADDGVKPMKGGETSASKKDDEKEIVEESKPEVEKRVEGSDKPKEKEGSARTSNSAQTEDRPAARETVTFATTLPGDPPFTDASTKHPEKCPPGGAWKGYFETATVRA